MAKKTTRSKPELQPAAPEAAAPAAKPRARAKSKNTASAVAAGNASVDAVDQSLVAPAAAHDNESVSMASEPSEDDIRLRAYHRYLERGGGHGMDFEDWLQAKRDLIAKK
jgi:hypothetical protein